jgi:FdhD protein
MSIVVQAVRINTRSNTREQVEENVALEEPINLFLNGHYLITLLATPELQEELALGWVLDEGLLRSFDEVRETVIDQDRINIVTTYPIDEDNLKVTGTSRLLATACGLTADKFFKTIANAGRPMVNQGYKVNAIELVKMVRVLDGATLFRATGGVHAAVLFEEERLVAFAEDVGRHNAIDKAVGIGLKSGIDFSRSVLISSGRQPADMVLKAARMGIPIVASKAAPVRSGIIAAEGSGVTLVCFVRDQRMNVYTYPHRIVETADS